MGLAGVVSGWDCFIWIMAALRRQPPGFSSGGPEGENPNLFVFFRNIDSLIQISQRVKKHTHLDDLASIVPAFSAGRNSCKWQINLLIKSTATADNLITLHQRHGYSNPSSLRIHSYTAGNTKPGVWTPPLQETINGGTLVNCRLESKNVAKFRFRFQVFRCSGRHWKPPEAACHKQP